ncbi:hypothetical protein BGZ65_007623, partial [Modicella reniformis]
MPGMAVNIYGMSSTKKRKSGDPVTIPKDTPAFKFIAEIKERKVGHYVVSWRVKLLGGYSIPNGLRFSVLVFYEAEPTDMSGSFDVALAPMELEKLGKRQPYGQDLDLDLELEELVVIQPHERKASIEISLSNTESERRFEYSGLQ